MAIVLMAIETETTAKKQNGSNSGIDPNKNPYADPFSEKWPNDNSSGNNGINDDESDISEDKRSIFNGIVFKRINLKGTKHIWRS